MFLPLQLMSTDWEHLIILFVCWSCRIGKTIIHIFVNKYYHQWFVDFGKGLFSTQWPQYDAHILQRLLRIFIGGLHFKGNLRPSPLYLGYYHTWNQSMRQQPEACRPTRPCPSSSTDCPAGRRAAAAAAQGLPGSLGCHGPRGSAVTFGPNHPVAGDDSAILGGEKKLLLLL